MFTRSTDMTLRFLLPCTSNVDTGAIAAAIEVAHLCGATLVPLSLRYQLKTEEVGVVQPTSQLSQHDFLEIVQRQAAIMEVPLEWFEISTFDVGQSIHLFAEEINCSGILLFVREGKGILLETKEVHYVITHERLILPFLVRLIPRKKTPFPLWYPFALLAVALIVVALVFLNGMALFQEPVFTLASLLVKLIFLCVITLSLTTILKFFVEEWRQKQ